MPIHSTFQEVTGSVALSEQAGVLLNSGSQTGLLVGGVAVSMANPVPITGTIAITPEGVQTVTGSVIVANTVNVVDVSGSVVGLLVGGNPVSNANPVPVNLQDTSVAIDVTASISILPAVALVTGTVVGISGNVNVTQGTTPWIVSGSDWTPTITGSVSLSGPITGSVGIAGPVAISNFPATQIVSASNWVPTITGSVDIANRVDTREYAPGASASFVSASANASVQLLAPNTARAGVTIFNNTNKNAWVLFGQPFTGMSASVGNFTTVLVPQDYYEVPYGYNGRIDAFSPNATNGAFQITEFF